MDTQTSQSFEDFYRALEPATRDAFAKAANSSAHYITYKLITGKRVARMAKCEELVKAAKVFGATFDAMDLFRYFYELNKKEQLDTLRKERAKTAREYRQRSRSTGA